MKVISMPRLESMALQAAESAGATDRIRESEDRLIVSMERFARHVVSRRRGNAVAVGGQPDNQVALLVTDDQRDAMRRSLQSLVDAAG